MNKKITYMLSMLLASALFTSCKNGNADFPDYEAGTTVYFAYQHPVRTIVLGDDEYDTTLDKAHKCKILATFGGSYNGSNGSVQVAVDPTLVNGLTFENGTPIKAMPESHYQLQTTNWAFNGTMNGGTEVQLTDAFFNDPDAVKETYVIPLVITSQTGFSRILSGTLKKKVDRLFAPMPHSGKYSPWTMCSTASSTKTSTLATGSPTAQPLLITLRRLRRAR